jgi:hypothetical protein
MLTGQDSVGASVVIQENGGGASDGTLSIAVTQTSHVPYRDNASGDRHLTIAV